MNTVGLEQHKKPPGDGALPTIGPPGAGAGGHPPPWIVIGPHTRKQMARLLEQHLSAVWVAQLETSGVPEGTGDEYKSAMGEVPSVVAALEATQFLKRLWGTGLWPAPTP